MTTNIAESMNSALRHVRKLPITPFMESIRAILQKWFHNKRIFAERTVTPLTGRVLSILQKNSADSEIFTVEPVDKYVYHVKGGTKDRVVNLTDKTYTCRRFNLDLISCSISTLYKLHLLRVWPDCRQTEQTLGCLRLGSLFGSGCDVLAPVSRSMLVQLTRLCPTWLQIEQT